jgi:hypothetical protein
MVSLIIKANILSGISFTLFTVLVFLVKPKAPHYLYSVYPYSISEDKVAFAMFLLMEIFTKGITVVGGVTMHAWVVCSIAFEIKVLIMLRCVCAYIFMQIITKYMFL